MTKRKKCILHIGDGGEWHFVNGRWEDGKNNLLTVPDDLRASDGYSIQGHHYAFHRKLCYKDVCISFEFRLNPISDMGIILRASDESHFYLLHFPNCGQASRAQHFWAAFSIMDESGYLKRVKIEMVRRVPSNSNLWLPAELILKGNRISVKIGEHGYFGAEDNTYSDPGCIGVYSSSYSDICYPDIRHVSIEGEYINACRWNDNIKQPTNWFHPCPQTKYGPWQRPIDLLRVNSGELLLSYNAVQGKDPEKAKITTLLARSSDNGRSWSNPEVLKIEKGKNPLQPPRLHLTPQGRLICLIKREEDYLTAETKDEGRTWSKPVSAEIVKPAGLKSMNIGPQAFLNLEDGSILMFCSGKYDLASPELTIYTWGSYHSQAFACRSTDDGHSWSSPVNLDNPGCDREGKPYEGNLDLSEVCGAQMSDGRILALIRPIYSPWMWETWSHDGGLTWTPCMRGPFPGYAAPNMVRTTSGAVLVAHRLPTLTIHCSLDEGHTWDRGTLIDGSHWAMGSMLEVEPDKVLYVYWDSFDSLMRAQFIGVTPKGLEPIRVK